MKLAGHAVHPMLVVFPLGLLSTAIVFDLVGLFSHQTGWHIIAFWMIAAGLVGGFLAAIFGLLDYIGLPRNTRARAVGFWHGAGNGLVMLLFAGSWLLRSAEPSRPGAIALVLAFIGAAVALVAGWLGGELVERLGIGVDEGAHPDAPSSLTGKPASAGHKRRDRRAA